MYPEELVSPMRKQLTDQGFSELKTVDDVENMIKNSGTTLVVVNSFVDAQQQMQDLAL